MVRSSKNSGSGGERALLQSGMMAKMLAHGAAFSRQRVKNGPPLAGHGAEAVRTAVVYSMNELPRTLRQSLTWDQGAEMAQHARLRIESGLEIYFCDPQSPWQRGSNENTSGILRLYFPNGTDLSRHSTGELAAVAHAMNTRARKKRLDGTHQSRCSISSSPNSPMLMLRRPTEYAQYVSIRYTVRLAEAGIEPSVGSVGDSYDNSHDQRSLHGGAHPQARTLAQLRGRRVRHADLGRLIQQSPAAEAHRQHPTDQGRGTLLRHAGRASHGGVTQTEWPPENPERFSPASKCLS